MRIQFWKLQSVGNDFPLVHPEDLPTGFDLSRLAVSICDRRFGVGGDGLLTLERVSGGLKMRMFNPDGTEDFCGNGLRCAAIHAHAIGWAGDEFAIEHGGRAVRARVDPPVASTVLGPASYQPSEVPLKQGVGELFLAPVFWDDEHTITGSALTTGSTHVIIPVVSLPEDKELVDQGRRIEHFGLYPARTSVIWRQELGTDHLRIRIWERGVGETWGCGTGSSAAAADYLRSEDRGGKVRVDNRGGTVCVEMAAWNAPITASGPAEPVYCGEFRFPG
jgi:diaminopimelate epimerase